VLKTMGRLSGKDLYAGSTAVDQASMLFVVADRRLEANFVWNEPLPTVRGVATVSRIEPRFSRVGATMTNGPVEVRCWSRQDWPRVLAEFRALDLGRSDPAGFAIADRRRINLDPWGCEHLDQLVYLHRLPEGSDQSEMASAVELLAHEIQHLVSPMSEAATECYGAQTVEQVARALGTPPRYARTLAVRYWNEGYPLMPANYRTKLCRNGGVFDANRGSARWP
jgi:hypothetical protein